MRFIKVLSQGLAAAVLVFAGAASAQTLFGVNPFQNDASAPPGSNGLFILNDTTGAIIGGHVVTVPARTITGLTGLARDPTNGVIYAIAKDSVLPGRLLITLNLATGAGVMVGNLGDSFSSIAFRPDGQLFGVTGDGATVPETLFTINKATAVPTLAIALGAGADGEVIAFHPGDNSFYHWSGAGGAVNFERILAVPPFTVTPITISAAASEVFGAVWNPATNLFLVHDINSVMSSWSTTGVISNIQAPTTDDVRGMVIAAAGIPTLSEWAIVLLIVLVGGVGFVAMRRRPKTA